MLPLDTTELEFTCKALSPIFMAGADGATPEWRAASIKGLLRFWWRALHPHWAKEGKLKEREEVLFGGTGGGEIPATKSKVWVRAVVQEAETYSTSLLPHKKSANAEAYQPESNFKIHLVLQENKYCTTEQLKALMILTSVLGGLGRRSRRGMGSFKLISVVDKSSQVAFEPPQSLTDLIPYLENLGCKFVKKTNTHLELANLREYQSLNYTYLKSIKLGKVMQDPTREVMDIAHLLNKQDAANYKKGIGNSSPRLPSPIYVSLWSDGKRPIISSLKIKEDTKPNIKKIQQAFISKLL